MNRGQQLPNGRWVSNGRKAILSCLDAVLGEPTNVQKYAKAFQDQIDGDPMHFFKEVVQPLIPKAMQLEQSGEEAADERAAELRNALAQMEQATATVKSELAKVEGDPPPPTEEDDV